MTVVLRVRRSDLNVIERVFTGEGFVAGDAFEPLVPDPDPQPLMLRPGANRIWFFPLALFGERFLDAGVYGFPAEDIEHGRYARRDGPDNGTAFDRSLFEQAAGGFARSLLARASSCCFPFRGTARRGSSQCWWQPESGTS